MTQTRHKISGWPLGLLLVLVLLLVHVLRQILVPFALAAGAAYVLTPFLHFLHKRIGLPRLLAAVMLYLAVVGVGAWAAWKIGAKIYGQATEFSTDVPGNTHIMVGRLLGGEQANLFGLHLDATQISDQITGLLQVSFAQSQATKIGGWVIGAGFTGVLFLVLLFYFLVQGRELARGFLRLAPPEYRPALEDFAGKAHPILLRYVRGLLVIVVFTAVVVSAGLGAIFHLKHAILLGLAAGILELLPVLGPTTAAFLLFGSVATTGGTLWTLTALGAFWFAVRQTIDQVVGPIVLGRAVRLPPVAVIFAFLAGGASFGVLGLLVAIPAAALFKLMLDTYYALPIE
jgi:predicted PurR-regulated permease PerM